MSFTLTRRFVVLGLSLLVASATVALVASPAGAKRYHPQSHVRVYKGAGTITSVDEENDTITLDLSKANRALRNALGGDLSNVTVAVDDSTDFSVNGDDSTDLSDVCADDSASFVIKTPDRLSGHDLSDHPASVVQVSAEDGEC